MVQGIFAFLIVIGVVVVVHEFGHFIAARSVGIKVHQFSIGFPPRMIGKKIGDTDYCLSWIPLGGYVKMAGMIDESMENPDAITGSDDEFMSKNYLQKTWVITAGVILNFLLAWVIYSGVAAVEGIGEPIDEPTPSEVIPDKPAAAAGIEVGDRITSIDDAPIETWSELVEVIHASAEKPLQITWERDGQPFSAEITPELAKVPVEGEIEELGVIGIQAPYEMRKVGLGEAVTAGGRRTLFVLEQGVLTIKGLFSRQVGVKDLGGPVLIASWSAESAKRGPTDLMLFIAFISINIGMLNILPIPVLDGGHFVMITLEAIARRPIPAKVKLGIQQVGMIGLLLLMAVILWNDIGRVGWLSKITGMF